MATRQETQNKRRTMRAAILESCRTGQVRDGEQIPPLRNLARQYGLSINLAAEVVQGLIAEGVLHSRQGAGTYVGSSRPADIGAFLFLVPEGLSFSFAASSYVGLVQRGFELRIAQMGGSCLALEAGQAKEYAQHGDLPPLAGIFAIDDVTACADCFEPDVPRAWFGQLGPEVAVARQCETAFTGDAVHFDDHDGGRQAARHLLALGHANIAFLALHATESPEPFQWSAEREAGWREAMLEANDVSEPLAFHPRCTPREKDKKGSPHGNSQIQAAREAAAALPDMVRQRIITAVVAANFFASRALFEVLEEAKVPGDLWPAVICFDNFDELNNHVVSALNLPWDEVGKMGAQLLWERGAGILHGPGQLRLAPMQLIPRLTCRPEWKNASSRIRVGSGIKTRGAARPVDIGVNTRL